MQVAIKQMLNFWQKSEQEIGPKHNRIKTFVYGLRKHHNIYQVQFRGINRIRILLMKPKRLLAYVQ